MNRNRNIYSYLPVPPSGVFGVSEGLEVDILSGVAEGKRNSALTISEGDGVSMICSISSSDAGSDLISGVEGSPLLFSLIFKWFRSFMHKFNGSFCASLLAACKYQQKIKIIQPFFGHH